MRGLGIVADDLTGAVDTGVQFACWGLHTTIALEASPDSDSEVVVITTDSRDEAPREAFRRAKLAADRLRGRLPYKKIDSTLRGNLGPELDGMLEALGPLRVLLAPAFPPTGRTTVDGVHMVNGVPLAQSAFAQDPIWPARESYIPAILARQTRRSIGLLPLAAVQAGPEAAAEVLKSQSAEIVVADATHGHHLRTIAFALGMTGQDWLPCGSAGLAEEWPAALGMRRPAGGSFHWGPDPRPVLVVAGSRHRSTAQQLRKASESGELDIVECSPGAAAATGSKAERLLAAGRNVAVTTTFSEYREGAGKQAADELAAQVAPLIDGGMVAGAFITGGDIARALCRRLGAAALHALGEVQPGVAMSELAGGPLSGFRVVTKAGGFGDELAILQSIDSLRGNRDE